MKLINFADESCDKHRKRLDPYLSNELTEETRLETLSHLERCPRCAEELETKRRLKDALRRAVNRDEPAPEELRQRILKQLDPQLRRTGWNHWWLAVAAMVVLSNEGFGMWRWLSARHGDCLASSMNLRNGKSKSQSSSSPVTAMCRSQSEL